MSMETNPIKRNLDNSKLRTFSTDDKREFGFKIDSAQISIEEARLFLKNLTEDCLNNPEMLMELRIIMPEDERKQTCFIIDQIGLTSTQKMTPQESETFFRTNSYKILYAESVTFLIGADNRTNISGPNNKSVEKGREGNI